MSSTTTGRPGPANNSDDLTTKRLALISIALAGLAATSIIGIYGPTWINQEASAFILGIGGGMMTTIIFGLVYPSGSASETKTDAQMSTRGMIVSGSAIVVILGLATVVFAAGPLDWQLDGAAIIGGATISAGKRLFVG